MQRNDRTEPAMPQATKVATCCYCGLRAALVFSDKARHELSCSGCGAPLHRLKALRTDVRRSKRPHLVHTTGAHHRAESRSKPQRRRKHRKKPKKTVLRRFLEEAVDAIEDIFD